MTFKKDCMKEKYLKAIIAWKYDKPYEEYNMEAYEELKKRNAAILNPEKKNNYVCYLDNDNLMAYTNITKREDGTIFLGIGLAPQYCGKGLGQEILLDSIQEIQKRYADYKILLQVRAWNKRAIKCYLNAGFTITKTEIVKDHNGIDTEFVFMKY